LPVEEVERDVRQQWRQRPHNNVAKRGLTVDRVIPRDRLKARYGQGWRSG
jgi:hypothetical protein